MQHTAAGQQLLQCSVVQCCSGAVLSSCSFRVFSLNNQQQNRGNNVVNTACSHHARVVCKVTQPVSPCTWSIHGSHPGRAFCVLHLAILLDFFLTPPNLHSASACSQEFRYACGQCECIKQNMLTSKTSSSLQQDTIDVSTDASSSLVGTVFIPDSEVG